MEIKILDNNTIDKIAAGEVVERPASVIKELIENSIDAGSDAISIEIKNGGIDMMRITDNGCGIEKEFIKTAFLRHSTSKIRSEYDLPFINTLGFRGEALSSIAAVSKLEICTKTKDSLTGIIYRINGGVEESLSEAGLPEGSTLIIRDLFYNTPARLKFLKSPQTEASYILDIIQKMSLSHPEISFKFISNGSVKISTSGSGSVKDVIYSIFGRDTTMNILAVNDSYDLITLDGYIGKTDFFRTNRNFEFIFINGRYVKDPVIQKAIEDAYEGYHMKGSFPFAVINLKIEPELVDVNVHPSKLEVRFYNSENIYNAVYNIIRSAVKNSRLISAVSIDKNPHYRELNKAEDIPEPFQINKKNELLKKTTNSDIILNDTKASEIYDISRPDVLASTINEKTEVKEEKNDLSVKFEQNSFFSDSFFTEKARSDHKIIGEIFNTYWIVEYENNMYLIDQHAAHEKVLYEKLVKRSQNAEKYSQYIAPALVISLSPTEEAALHRYKQQFYDMGFEFDDFGGSDIALKAVPCDLYDLDCRILMLEMLDDLSAFLPSKLPQALSDRMATAACKAAVKGGKRLSDNEISTLIDELLTLDNPFNCPHGRPTIISISKNEIEKKFRRIV